MFMFGCSGILLCSKWFILSCINRLKLFYQWFVAFDLYCILLFRLKWSFSFRLVIFLGSILLLLDLGYDRGSRACLYR